MEDKDFAIINKKLNIASSSISGKFDQSDWLAIEKECSKFDKQVIQCLINLGENKSGLVKEEYFAMGDEMYNLFFDLINSKFPLRQPKEKKRIKKQEKKQLKKADIIRVENAKNRIKDKLEELIKIFDEKQFNPQQAFTSDIIEIKGVGLLYCGWYIVNNQFSLLKIKQLPFVLGIIATIQRYINACQNMKGKSLTSVGEQTEVSKKIITDLQFWLTKSKTIYPYNGFVIYDYAPELLVYTDFDLAVPREKISPREHQNKVIDIIKTNIDTGFVMVYNAMIGSGKTACSVAIASLISMLRSQSTKYQNLELLFCCNLRSVKNQVANLCYNAGIKFGLAHIDKRNNSFRIINHNTCKNDES